MRLRNNKNAPDYLAQQTKYIIQDKTALKKECLRLFKNPHQLLYLEIGMGKGDFIINQALRSPHINFIGLEKFDTVIVKAHKKALQFNLHNLAMISADATDLAELFKDLTVDRLFLNFSDPWPKKRHAKKRLVHTNFLNIFAQVLKTDGVIEFKTDNDGLFDYLVNEVIAEHPDQFEVLYLTYDLYENDNDPEYIKNIPTEYEQKFIAQNIKIKKIIFKYKPLA
ncbi:tRNA (guanosine(46)-N7)-methyltransferase TrmB [Ureaplasma miroungigenitalium]|uniref:tRNA (guanine-N(7)-)-methyltransferase n=1 Tax=Ureaplasma miroungigenitalium TaxID=1042321 RepID=A0ABT3BM13_9BACT|nr:tRNA (guanosine(46)-N7)-methyltransferase TrmB [Ureaplasma miroungigenitalium]MCV3728289.1 tRNA (guanosine(46)-N7)-methyltransferase TrmB [Ureaplasma miroungigenitalium]MCV3734094.1 tRNA (guanosine(46)-N7)-methyltransferase TrmB [Ureaplasma miroungigenitalium]